MVAVGLKPQQVYAAEKVHLRDEWLGPKSVWTYIFAVIFIFVILLHYPEENPFEILYVIKCDTPGSFPFSTKTN
jgi:hypothetical protein